MKYSVSTIAALALAGGTAFAAAPHAHGYKGEELAGRAHVSMTSARMIALKARPGRITDAELEKEGGGSGLRYSFDIASRGKTFEVGVDAANGRVLENKAEGAHPD
ncbi:MAG: PepSY domain-containing protein [Sphingomonadaceae bacterium]|nr:PepSY domain-containing protein [Sphingomonadaceae bacterium]